MDLLFLGIIVFLFLLAAFDLTVGVSNDAVNFLNSAVGAQAASFRRILTVAAVGVFVGAVMSNGMMDIARHGIFRPEHFAFYDLMCIFMAVMVTDILLLDLFNTLGLPTSTTVSMVFELLGATFALAVVKLMHDPSGLTLGDLMNTEKALSVIIGIFLSVAIAFVFGAVVQFLSRLLFTFNYRRHLRGRIGLFGGVATTAILYFLLIKGAKDLTFMTPEVKSWVAAHTAALVVGCLVGATVVMQVLHWLGVQVLKVVVLLGTFALAVAFAGNDLVNFIGVPLSGFAAYQDYAAHGGGDATGYLMSSLNSPANTPIYFLVAAGVIMVAALATSRKARRVIQTEVGLGSQNAGDEMFGSSRIARRVVRTALSVNSWVREATPPGVSRWVAQRFDTRQAILADGASFDLVRGCVNLTLAAMLIALGTSMKLPLSTTYVSFMVAMGTSLADKAWGRESAVFRITGVISVIGGWFMTAGLAFIGAALVAALMHRGGTLTMLVVAGLAVAFLIRSNLNYRRREAETPGHDLLHQILTSKDERETWELLQRYLAQQHSAFIRYASERYADIVRGFIDEEVKPLSDSAKSLDKQKYHLKNIRRRETLGFQRVHRTLAIEHNASFYLANNCCMSILYNLRRIAEVCQEHVANNFHPLPSGYQQRFTPIYLRISRLWQRAAHAVRHESLAHVDPHQPSAEVIDLRMECDAVKEQLSAECRRVHDQIQVGDAEMLAVSYVYLNLLQETREAVSTLRKLLRAAAELQIPMASVHP
jgi:phosphate/sulfate permease